MVIIEFVPGAVVSPNPITIPASAPNIQTVVAAQIHRIPSAMAIPNHLAVDIQGGAPINNHAIVAHAAAAGGPEACAGGAVDPHPAHDHPIAFGAGGAGSTVIAGAAALTLSAGAQVVGGGGAAADGVRNTTIAAHVFTQPTITHANVVAGIDNHPAVVHAFGAGAPVVHGANVGASPVVAAAPTRLTTRTISLDVNTVLGDLLMLAYRQVGEVLLAV